MRPKREGSTSVETHRRQALATADDMDARYHRRSALQKRSSEEESSASECPAAERV